MDKSTIKQTLEKFRELANSNRQINQHLAGNVEMSLDYYKKKYKPTDLITHEKQVIVEASEHCYNVFVQFYKRTVFDSSIYALCSLGASYGADQYMYDNGVQKAIHPLTKIRNGGLTDNELGEIEAFNNLCVKFGNPSDLSETSYTDMEKIVFLKILHTTAVSDGRYDPNEVLFISLFTEEFKMGQDLINRANSMLHEDAFKFVASMDRVKKVDLIRRVRDIALIDEEFHKNELQYTTVLMRHMGLSPEDLK